MRHLSGRRTKCVLSIVALGLMTVAGGCAASGHGAWGKGLDEGFEPAGRPSGSGDVAAMVDRVEGRVSAARLRHDVDVLAGFGTRHTLSDTQSDTRGIGAARRWIRDEFQRAADASGRTGADAMVVRFDPHTVQPDGRRITRPVEVVNVICEIPGSSPEARSRLYYVTAHYDTICSDHLDPECDAPGANDDASGTAMLIELARVLGPERLDGTIVLMATAGEEQGLYGARLHARAAREAGLDIRANLNNDTIGDPKGPYGYASEEAQWSRGTIRIFSEGIAMDADSQEVRAVFASGRENDSDARAIARLVADVADRHAMDVRPTLVYRNDRYLRGGDHTAFLENGYPAAVRFTVAYEDYNRQHQNVRDEVGPDGAIVRYGDLAEYVEAPYLADVTALNAAALIHLAGGPAAPEGTAIVMRGLEPVTRVRWSAPAKSPDVAGYEVLVRETSAPRWEHVRDVGMTNEVVLGASKDNWLFGVRAYDSEGRRGPVSFPAPVRE